MTEENPDRREPLFTIHADEDTYRYGGRHVDSLCELTDGTVLPIDVMRRMRCGSRYQSVVLDAAGVMLHFGREERFANRALRRALAARDRGCAVPGCDRPPAHCDAHHVVFREHPGGTDIDNMVLLCRHHHNAIHSDALSVLMVDGMPLFLDRNGTSSVRVGDDHRPTWRPCRTRRRHSPGSNPTASGHPAPCGAPSRASCASSHRHR